MNSNYQFINIAPVFLSSDVKRTVDFYVSKLGFKYAKNFDKKNNFATIYKDTIEFVIVQKKKGTIKSNYQRYGNGYDAYIDTKSIEGVDKVYNEYKKKGIKIIIEPRLTDYGSYEFVFEDIDGRRIGIGLIKEKKTFFKESNYINIKSNR